MNEKDIINLEVDLFIELVKQRYHWDFSHYKYASLKRRILLCVQENRLHHISDLFPKLLRNEKFFHSIIETISVPVSEMFRDPETYLFFRKEIIPILKTYPFFRIWHAGCANGKEVYSAAIMLLEEGLYEKCELVGSDINKRILNKANEGIYPLSEIESYRHNYHNSGGIHELLDYFHITLENAAIINSLKKNVTFLYHDLVTGTPLKNINVIICRNVFIYFDLELQNQVIKLFLSSLNPGGFLWLGTKESIKFTNYSHKFEVISDKYCIYRKPYE